MTVSRMIARPMLASIFVVGATTALKSTSGPAAKADPVTSRLVPLARKAGIPLPEDPETLVKLNAGVQIGAGRRYEGPVGKSDRAVLFGGVGLLLGVGVMPGAWLTWLMALAFVLSLVTVVNRVRAALREVA